MEEQNIINETSKGQKQKKNTSGKGMSLKSILGGDILANDFLKRQTSF